MSISNIIVIVFLWMVASGLLGYIPAWMDKDVYTGCGDSLIYVTKREPINWLFTHFLTPLAVLYDNLCDRINGQGLALLMIWSFILTLPFSLLLTIVGLISLMVREIWHRFCRKYAREVDEC